MSEDINTVEKPIEWYIWGISYDCEEFFYEKYTKKRNEIRGSQIKAGL